MPNCANISFLGLFVRPCIDRPEIIDEGPNYASGLLSEFHAGARCPSVLAPSGGAKVKVYS